MARPSSDDRYPDSSASRSNFDSLRTPPSAKSYLNEADQDLVLSLETQSLLELLGEDRASSKKEDRYDEYDGYEDEGDSNDGVDAVTDEMLGKLEELLSDIEGTRELTFSTERRHRPGLPLDDLSLPPPAYTESHVVPRGSYTPPHANTHGGDNKWALIGAGVVMSLLLLSNMDKGKIRTPEADTPPAQNKEKVIPPPKSPGKPGKPQSKPEASPPKTSPETKARTLEGLRKRHVLEERELKKVEQIAARLNTDPRWLLAAMSFETGGAFRSDTVNRKSGATGLIQFMPRTARRLGTSTAELARMDEYRQLDFVEEYLKPFKGRLNSLEDVYMSILWPAAVGKSNDYRLFMRGIEYQQNKGLDSNRDGTVTKAEAAAKVRQHFKRLFG